MNAVAGTISIFKTKSSIGSYFQMEIIGPSIPEESTVHRALTSLYHTESINFALISRSTSLPDGAMRAEDFMKQLFPDTTDRELYDVFKADLDKELAAGAISKIKYHRLIAQMTQHELSKTSGMKQANIARIESRGYTPTIATLKKIANALGVDMKELLQ